MQQVIIRDESYLQRISELIKTYKNISIFTGKRSFSQMQASSDLMNILKKKNCLYIDDVEINPTLESIEAIADRIKLFNTEFIIAVGGGSVIDTAKSARYLLNEKVVSVNLLAIPTTAGTGSESTQFATYYIGTTKHSFDDSNILPQYVILSPDFTELLPTHIVAQTGVDALCQAIESYWSNSSTLISKHIAKESIEIIIKNLENAVAVRDRKSRQMMLIAANLSGQAINITRTTIAHSVSYPLTSFFNIPHGQAVSVTLPHFIEYNWHVNKRDCLDSRGPLYVKKTIEELNTIFGVNDYKEFKNELLRMFKNIGLETSLEKLINFTENGIDIIVDNGFTPSRIKNNPRNINKEELKNLLRTIK